MSISSLTLLPKQPTPPLSEQDEALLIFWNKCIAERFCCPDADQTNLQEIRTKFWDEHFLDKLNSITSINLSKCGLKAIPLEMGKCVNLEELDLRNNHISPVPQNLLPSNLKVYLAGNPFAQMSTLMNSRPGFCIIEADINFAKSEFLNRKEYSLFRMSEAESRRVKIECYPKNEAVKKFNLKEHGLQFCTLPKDLLSSFDLQNPFDNDNKFQFAMNATPFVLNYMKENNIPGVPIPLNETSRSDKHEHRERKDIVPPLHIAHVDYDKKDLADTTQRLMGYWKPKIEYAFKCRISNEEYDRLKPPHLVINLWVILNELPCTNTLALMDISRAPGLADQLRPITFQHGLTSAAPLARSDYPWVVQEKMARGDAVLFTSTDTPHTAVTISEIVEPLLGLHLQPQMIFAQPGVDYVYSRESFEIRYGVFPETKEALFGSVGSGRCVISVSGY